MTCRDLPFSGLASAAFALALIAGCSGDDSASGSESDSATATATATDSSTTNGSKLTVEMDDLRVEACR